MEDIIKYEKVSYILWFIKYYRTKQILNTKNNLI